MGNTILIKGSNTSSEVPSSLTQGSDDGNDDASTEIAINRADGKLYYLNSSDSVTEYTPISAGGGIALSGQTLSVSAATGLAQISSGLGLAHLGLESLSDPDADRIFFWDDSAGAAKFLQIDGTLDITGTTLSVTSSGGAASAITVNDESADTTCFPVFVTAAAGDLAPKSGSNLLFNSSTGSLEASIFRGLVGTATQGTIDHDSLANFVAAEHVDWAGSGTGTIHATNYTDTNTTYSGGTNLTLSTTTFNVDDAFLVNDASDTTSGTITAAGFTTTGNYSVAGHTFNDIDITSESSDADDHIMTALAIKNKIEDYGYSTEDQLTTEEVEDIVGGMLTGNTETNITVTYQDGDGTIDFVATDTNTTYAAGTGISIVGGGNSIVHDAHTSEVTGDTALTITDNVVDEANLKVSNSPTNGYALTAQSGNTGGLTWADISSGGAASQVVVAADSSDSSCSLLFVTAAAGDLEPKSNTGLTFDSTNGKLTSTFVGPLNGAVTGNVTGNCTGTAATVTGGTQASITSAANLTTVGTIGTGVWQGTAIASGYIAGDAITGAKIADDAIDSEHYTDGSIDNAHIADNAIDSEHYADGSIDNAHIADNAIDSEHYADGSIDNAHIADNAIDSEHYAAGSIDLEHMASQSVDEDNLYISNSGSNGQFLSKQSGNNGGMTWATPTDTNTTYTAGTGLDLSSTEFSVDVSDFMTNGSNNFIVTATGADGMNAETGLRCSGHNLYMTEQSNADAEYLNMGQVWVKTGAPCELYFTTDAGDDIQITDGTSIAGGGGGGGGNADTITFTENSSANETVYISFADSYTGSQEMEADQGLYYNPSTGILVSTGLRPTGDIVAGGDVSGQSGQYMHGLAIDQGAAVHGLNVGVVGGVGTITYFNPFSDSRLKTDVSDYSYGLAEIKQLNTKFFKYDKTAHDSSGLVLPPEAQEYPDNYYGRENYGLMADNVKSVMPKAVSLVEEGKDYETYDKDALIFALINSVKELEERVVTLEAA